MNSLKSPCDPDRLSAPLQAGNKAPSTCGCTSYRSLDKNYARTMNDKVVPQVKAPRPKWNPKFKIKKSLMVSRKDRAAIQVYEVKGFNIADFDL